MSQHDFDFLFGEWRIANRKLDDPLAEGSNWLEFEATRRLVQAVVFRITHHADDLVPTLRRAIKSQVLADGMPGAPESPCQRVVDDENRRASRRSAADRAPLDQAAWRLDVSGRHGQQTDRVLASAGLLAGRPSIESEGHQLP
jgi:hypothetical protein